MTDYTEPPLSVCVLDFVKPEASRACLESIKQYIKVPHRVIYYHNGPAEYAYQFYQDGLVDLFMQSRVNAGLGVGTRDLFAASQSRHTLYLQNDQTIIRDLGQDELNAIVGSLGQEDHNGDTIASISLAGPVGGAGVYSERAHIIETAFYREMEHRLPLPVGGAGPHHHQRWREAAIQELYREHGYTHFTDWQPLVRDNGVWTIRDINGGRVHVRTDTKQTWWERLPTEPYIFPEHTAEEWEVVLAGRWPQGAIPVTYRIKGESFNCWGHQPAPI